MPARQLLPRTVGLLAVTYGVWLLASPLLAGAPQLGGRLYLIFPGIPGLLIGATGVLLWCQDYRRLAKLWIGILALVLLVFLTRAPGQLGVDLRNLTPDEPWPIVASFAIAGVAIWVCQRFVVGWWISGSLAPKCRTTRCSRLAMRPTGMDNPLVASC